MDRRALLGLRPDPKAAPVKTGGGGSSSPDTYVRFPTVTASVVRPDGRRGVLSVETGVDVADAALRERARRSVPRLRDAYAAVAQRAGQALRPGFAPDIDALGRELQAATDRVLGAPGARLLLGTVMAT